MNILLLAIKKFNTISEITGVVFIGTLSPYDTHE